MCVYVTGQDDLHYNVMSRVCVCHRPGWPTFQCHITCVYNTGQDDLYSNVMSHMCVCHRPGRPTFQCHVTFVCMLQARTTYIPMLCHVCVYVACQDDLHSNVIYCCICVQFHETFLCWYWRHWWQSLSKLSLHKSFIYVSTTPINTLLFNQCFYYIW